MHITNTKLKAVYIEIDENEEEGWTPMERPVIGWGDVIINDETLRVALVAAGGMSDDTMAPASSFPGFVMIADSTTTITEIVRACRTLFAELEEDAPDSEPVDKTSN